MTFPFTVKPLLSEITLGCGYSKYCFEYSKEYLRITNVVKEKEYATLSSAAILLKLAVYPNSIYKKKPRTVYLANLR